MAKTWANLSKDEQSELARIYKRYGIADRAIHLTNAMSAMGLTSKVGVIERACRSFNYYERVFEVKQISIPESPKRQYLDYPQMATDNCLIISDIEIPDHNADMLKIAMLDAIANGVTDCVIAGDLIATDQAALTAWVATWATSDMTTYEADIHAVRFVLKEYLKHFKRVVIISGNHDDRIARKTGGELHLGMLLHDLPVTFSRYEYMWLRTSNRGDIKIVHPQNFSGNPVTLGQKLYNVDCGVDYPNKSSKSHIVLGHCHRQQSGWSEDGLHEIHALGCMRDSTRTLYKQQHINKHFQWDSGYMMLIDGYFYPRTLKGTHWQKVLGDLYDSSPLVKGEK